VTELFRGRVCFIFRFQDGNQDPIPTLFLRGSSVFCFERFDQKLGHFITMPSLPSRHHTSMPTTRDGERCRYGIFQMWNFRGRYIHYEQSSHFSNPPLSLVPSHQQPSTTFKGIEEGEKHKKKNTHHNRRSSADFSAMIGPSPANSYDLCCWYCRCGCCHSPAGSSVFCLSTGNSIRAVDSTSCTGLW